MMTDRDEVMDWKKKWGITSPTATGRDDLVLLWHCPMCSITQDGDKCNECRIGRTEIFMSYSDEPERVVKARLPV